MGWNGLPQSYRMQKLNVKLLFTAIAKIVLVAEFILFIAYTYVQNLDLLKIFKHVYKISKNFIKNLAKKKFQELEKIAYIHYT